jgi:thiamine kinase-like enzyme
MTDLDAIVDQLQRRLGAAAGPPVALDGGITNRNYRVQLGEHAYVLRLPGKDTELLGISRQAERIANEQAASLGIAPEMVAASDEWLLTRYLDCRPIDPDGLRAAPEGVGRALRAFHDSGVALPVTFWVPDLLDDYAEIVAQRGGVLHDSFERSRGLARRIAGVLPLSAPAPCHNDLLPGNLVTVGPRVFLVDWEYAGMGHRMFDLGNVAVNNEFDDAADERLLTTYFGEPPGPSRRAALALMRIMSDAREAAWGVVQGVISELDFDFGAYADEHFERLLAAAADPRLEQWFDAASA